MDTKAMAPKINPTYNMEIFRENVKKIARKGHVAPMPKERAEEAIDAAQKSFLYPLMSGNFVNLNHMQIK
ncbi:MAG: hypothetical protein ACYCUZ_05865 [Cuniculiplasma sp.]|jgi:hypothetical protein